MTDPVSAPVTGGKAGGRLLKTLAQALVTVLLLVWLLHGMDWNDLLRYLLDVRTGWLVGGIGIYLFSLAVSAARWWVIMDSLERRAPLSWLMRLNWVGAFFNQVLPGAVSGDAVRALYTRPHVGSLPVALAAVFADRFLGLGALLVVALAAFTAGGKSVAPLPHMELTLLALAGGYAALLFLVLSPRLDFVTDHVGRLGEKIHEARLALRALFRHRGDLAIAVGISLVVQALSIAMFWVLARSLGERPDWVAVWLVWPVVSLFMALPISFAGWGLREGLIVYYFTHLGMSADHALALSLLSGFAVLAASLPGSLVWLALGKKPAQALRES